jgi:hypothetical protein
MLLHIGVCTKEDFANQVPRGRQEAVSFFALMYVERS